MVIKQENDLTGFEIAIIGMDGRFPGAKNIEEYWENLKNGVESIEFLTQDEIDKLNIENQLLNDHRYVKVKGGRLEGKEYFDYGFFGYTPKEAGIMDPQMRIFHECAYRALEDAGCNPYLDDKLIGMYVGCSSSFIWKSKKYLSNSVNDLGAFAVEHLTNKDFMASKVAYKLNLRGPVVTIQTACSTSLVAIHMACRALLTGECNIALAGGVKLDYQGKNGYLYQEGMVLSADGHCRPFDSSSSGTVGGEGVGVVVLKPLKTALKDGDSIYAVVKGSAINNDGFSKVGYTAPSVIGQSNVIKSALRFSKVEPESISYIEAHGTATQLGDVVEFQALKSAYNLKDSNRICRIGAVKANIGHLDVAAGVAGFIKTVLALNEKKIPPNINFYEPNSKIDINNSHFHINKELCEWSDDKYPLRAGISSFAIGGTNAHVILQEPPKVEAVNNEEKYNILNLSAKTSDALENITKNLIDFLKINNNINITDLCYSLSTGRNEFQYKRALVCSDINEIIDELDSDTSRKVITSNENAHSPQVVFMFSGIGAQYINMGIEIYKNQKVFYEEMNNCFRIANPILGCNLEEVLYNEERSEGLNKRLEVSQCIIFSFEYALSKLLISWGITPAGMIGYSLGEYVAACISEALEVEDAIKFVIMRAMLIGKSTGGDLLTVPLSKNEISKILGTDISIAIDNGDSCVITGKKDAINKFSENMKKRKVICYKLDISCEIHSKAMGYCVEDIKDLFNEIRINKIQIPYISNVTGTWVKESEINNADYWMKHLTETVKFGPGIEELKKLKNTVFIEIGAGNDLSNITKRIIDNSNQRVINIIKSKDMNISDGYFFMSRIARLWTYGVTINWKSYYCNETRKKLHLPTYPFDRNKKLSYDKDIDVDKLILEKINNANVKENQSNYLYAPYWKQTYMKKVDETKIISNSNYIVFVDDYRIADEVIEKLIQNDCHFFRINKGKNFKKIGDYEYCLNPSEKCDYELLIENLRNINNKPITILHFWSLSSDELGNYGLNIENNLEYMQQVGVLSLIYLVQALSIDNVYQEVYLKVITNKMYDVTGNDYICPEKATLVGAIKVIPQEFPNISCQSIDIVIPMEESKLRDILINQIYNEAITKNINSIVAYRGNRYYIQDFEKLPLDKVLKDKCTLKKNGTYLITGGLGNIGLELATYLAKEYNSNLILTRKSSFPSEDRWKQWLNEHQDNNPISLKIKRLYEIKQLGGRVNIEIVDVSDYERMEQIVCNAESIYGKIDGIIHAAGVVDKNSFKAIENISIEDFEIQFKSKVYGTLVLEKIIQNRVLDFCLLISSSSVILGGLGFSTYSAANSYMDSMVKKQNKNNKTKWITVNLGTIGNNNKKVLNEINGLNLEDDFTDDQKIFQSIRDIISANLIDQVIISDEDLESKMKKWSELKCESNPNSSNKNEGIYLSNEYKKAANEYERKLVDIWENFFGISSIGIMDNFFELGGDSLKAIVLISRLEKEFNVKLSVPTFFKLQTIKELSDFIKKSDRSKSITIQKTEKRELYPLSSAQKRLFLLNNFEDIGITYNVPFVFEISGKLDFEKLQSAIRHLISRHEILRTTFIFTDNQPMQKIHDNFDFNIERLNLYNNSIDDTIRLFIKPYDLSKLPLMRVGLLESQKDNYILIFDVHHIIMDGVALGILTRDLTSLYKGEDLEELAIQYRDYAVWQNEYKKTDKYRKIEKYWLDLFKREIPLLSLPTDYKRENIFNFKGDSYEFELNSKLTTELRKICKEAGTTMYMNLLAAFFILLNKYTGQEDIVVGTGISGRNHNQLENLIGLFVNMLAIRTNVYEEENYLQFLSRIKETCITAYDNEGMQFEDLVKKLKLTRDPSRNSIFDVTFVNQNFESSFIELDNLTFSSYEYSKKTTYYDLTLFANEIEDKIKIKIVYSTSLFKQATIEKIALRFIKIIEQIIENREVKLGGISIILDSELFSFDSIEYTEFEF